MLQLKWRTLATFDMEWFAFGMAWMDILVAAVYYNVLYTIHIVIYVRLCSLALVYDARSFGRMLQVNNKSIKDESAVSLLHTFIFVHFKFMQYQSHANV